MLMISAKTPTYCNILGEKTATEALKLLYQFLPESLEVCGFKGESEVDSKNFTKKRRLQLEYRGISAAADLALHYCKKTVLQGSNEKSLRIRRSSNG